MHAMASLFSLRLSRQCKPYHSVITHFTIRLKHGKGILVHNDSASGKWIGTYRRLPPIVYQIPFILAFGFIFYVSFDWFTPYIRPDIFEEEDRRMKEKLLLRIDRYLDWNSQRDDVIALESGLQMKKINRKSVVEDKKPTLNDSVMIHYQGQYIDGTEFDNSVEKNRPVSVKVDTLIDGLREGIQHMNEGDCYEFYIHPNLGYGYDPLDKAPGEVGVEGNSVLIYSLKLLRIITDDDVIDSQTQNMTLFTEY